MHLDESKFFVTFVFKNLPEQGDLVIIFEVGSNTVNDCAGPLYNQCFQAVLLVKVGVHVLLHSFHWEFAFSTFDVVFYFLLVDVIYHVLQLL